MAEIIGYSTIDRYKTYTVTDFEIIKQDLSNALNIRQGEMPGRPNIGTTMFSLIFEPQGEPTNKAIIKEIPKTGLLLKELPPEEMKNGFYRVQRIDLAELEELTSTKLLPYVIRLSPESEHGYYRKWPLPGSGEDKHNGYAFQWFAFATVLFIIYFLLNIKLKDL